jgi:hypothetical protein
VAPEYGKNAMGAVRFIASRSFTIRCAEARGIGMRYSSIARRLALTGATFALVACQDSSNPVEPAGPLGSRATSQDALAAAFGRVSPEVMALPGTVFADHDETVNKLVFGVENSHAIPGVQRVLAARGIPSADYQIQITEPIRQLATLRDRFRPTQAGIQIHFSNYVCTMGFNVDHAKGRSFITNSHCTKTQGGTEGTVYYQPSSSIDAGVIATEADDPQYFKGGVCPKGKKCRYSDAARALYSSSASSNRGEIAKTTGANNGSLTVSGFFTVTSQDNATTNFTTGTVLNKVGRTTGWSQGPVSRTCVNTNVQGSQVHQLCQTFVDAAVNGGDSGSPVFRITSGDNVQLVGILWGGGSSYYVMSPLKQIQQELGTLTATK